MTNDIKNPKLPSDSPLFWLLTLMHARNRNNKVEETKASYELAQQGISVSFGVNAGRASMRANNGKRK